MKIHNSKINNMFNFVTNVFICPKNFNNKEICTKKIEDILRK